jgi:hypothetical protein
MKLKVKNGAEMEEGEYGGFLDGGRPAQIGGKYKLTDWIWIWRRDPGKRLCAELCGHKNEKKAKIFIHFIHSLQSTTPF